MNRVRGLTLVELLLSIVLALFLVVAILQVYRIGKSILRWQVEVARMEENGRHALGLITRELGMAGFFGRAALADLPATAADAPACGNGWALDLRNPLDLLNDFGGGEARFAGGARLDCLPESQLVPGADALAIKRSAALPSRSAAGESALRDLNESRWFLFTETGGVPFSAFVDAEGEPAAPVPVSATWWELRASIFYLRNYSQSPGDGVPTLCDERLGSDMRSVCLVEGVERLAVAFGVDTDSDGVADRLETAPVAAQLASAVTARVTVLMRSLGELHRRPTAQSLRLEGELLDLPPDRYLRRVFSATVSLHNVLAQAGGHALR